MRRKSYQIASIAIAFLLLTSKSFGQADSVRYKLIESLSKDIYKYYVSRELAKQMIDSINQKYRDGGYDGTLNMDEFAFEITRDLRRISNDNHLTVTPPRLKPFETLGYDTVTPKELRKRIEKNKKMEVKHRQSLNEDKFIYGDIKILPKNVGYVEIKNFSHASVIKSENRNRISIESVFHFLRKTNSLIIDLRENAGGFTILGAKFCSYFANQPNSYFITEENFIRVDSNGTEIEYSLKNKVYTDGQITNNLTKDKNIYILISNRTFSAAELAIYKIKQYVPSVTVIGEQTRGGGNGYFGTQSNKYYSATIPSSKSFDEANANYNIEGRGITPDIYSVADSALQIAYRLASSGNFDTAIQDVEYFRKNEVKEVESDYRNYYLEHVGDYHKAAIYIKNGKLHMLYDTFKMCLLIPVGEDLYDANDDFEYIRFARNSNKQVSQILIKHKNGYLERFRKK